MNDRRLFKVALRCRICGHAWTAEVVCVRVDPVIGFEAPTNEPCDSCGHAAADGTPNQDDNGQGRLAPTPRPVVGSGVA